MRDEQRRDYVWRNQDCMTLAQAATSMGVSTMEARRIYDEAMRERVGRRA
jgi:hypothetical protein